MPCRTWPETFLFSHRIRIFNAMVVKEVMYLRRQVTLVLIANDAIKRKMTFNYAH